jgi:serine phosphatase RsbU (regulator of sigma subunit)
MTSSLYVEVPGEPPFEVRLERDVMVVGRQDTDLALRDMNVSRRHFRVERAPAVSGFVLRDERSRNGTFVNGVSVLDKMLVEGDRIQVGGSTLTFRLVASPSSIPLELAPRPLATPRAGSDPALSGSSADVPVSRPSGMVGRAPATVSLPPGARRRELISPSTPLPEGPWSNPPVSHDLTIAPGYMLAPAVAGGPVPLPRPAPPAAGEVTPRPPLPEGDPGTKSHQRPSRAQVPVPAVLPPPGERWRLLADVACAINGEHDIDRLLERILDAVLTLVPAKSGFLVLREGGELVVKANRNAPDVRLDATSDGAGDAASRYSQQVCNEAIAQRRPVLTQDAISDEKLGQFQTVMSLRLKSILCVPFSSNDVALGVVYLDEPQVDPFAEEGEVVELVGAFGDLAGIALQNARHLRETAARERLEEELRIASRIQRNLLPKAVTELRGLELAGRTMPAREVGGDLYDFFRRPPPESEVVISIGDVSGKGIGAGLVMVQVRSLLRAYAESYRPTDELLVHVNRALAGDLEPGQFVSFLLMRYEEESGHVSFTGAGHEHLILFRPGTGQLELMRAGGVVLGLMPDVTGRLVERHMTLQPGDVICLYTDGATEAHSPTGEEFGLERVAAALQAGPLDPESIVKRVIDQVVAFTGEGRELADDLTVVALRRV